MFACAVMLPVREPSMGRRSVHHDGALWSIIVALLYTASSVCVR